ncbi:hypothetical protein SAMN04488134_113105 [Amphibacillus marinus]|uniref:Uncharacterized protein n=1 Tax=Amphibacillus marinus TaxID=872970 RepID=A0A1H8SUI8_9BACI|nr:hypothetical protein [Amphibacillus marinus]SEO82028.1 hypothetical protein SAMN04488134_113105 [Amphibacillus marinus]
MTVKKILCEKCNDEILGIEELVTDNHLFDVVAYHELCYARDIKRGKGFFLAGQPINSVMGNCSFFLAALAFLVSFFIEGMFPLFTLVLAIPISYRAYSYFMFERPLKKG